MLSDIYAESVTYKPFMLSVIMPNVVMLSVAAPLIMLEMLRFLFTKKVFANQISPVWWSSIWQTRTSKFNPDEAKIFSTCCSHLLLKIRPPSMEENQP